MSWRERFRWRSRREVLAWGLVLAGMTAFVLLAYTVIVLGGGVLAGSVSAPPVVLSVLATAVVALSFDAVQVRLEALVSRAVRHGRPSPYDVLRTFSRTVAGSQDAGEIPGQMARMLTEGTGAQSSQVWVVVGEHPVIAATWPTKPIVPVELSDDIETAADPRDQPVPGRRVLPVSHGGELLGLLVVQERENVPLTSVEERLFSGLARQAGLVLRGVRLRAELERRRAELSVRARELRSSRQRLVDVQDGERRRLERDIHDGAQQHLVALAVNLRLAQTLSARSPERADVLLAGQEQAAIDAVATLVQLSQGIYPPLLGEAGLTAALTAVAGGPGGPVVPVVPVEIVASQVRRYSPDLEAAAYFCCLEALQNAAKHSGAALIRVTLTGGPDTLSIVIEDDGAGFDPAVPPAGQGLSGMRDRIESAGGTLRLESTPGHGTRIQARLPVASLGRMA